MTDTWRDRIGDYRLIREIGRGAFGIVYEAVQESLERRVALKVLPAELFPDPIDVKRFQQEAMAAAQLSHPNIVTVHEAGHEGDIYYFSMEYVEGKSLAQELAERGGTTATPELEDTDFTQSIEAVRGEEKKPEPAADKVQAEGVRRLPSREECREIAAKALGVAEALSYAHAKGIIHQDIKPSNLVIDSTGRLCLLDFGTAQIRRLRDDPQLTGGIVTPLYASPEQLGIEPGPVGPQTDIWSFGATLYEWLTLSPPFPAVDYQDLLKQVSEGKPLPPRELNPEIPRDLEAVVLKALQRKPSDRYSSADQLAEDLRRFVRSQPTAVGPRGPFHRFVLWKRRNPALAKAVLALVLFVVLAASAAAYVILSRETPLERAERHIDNEAYRAALPLLEKIQHDDPSWPEAVRLKADCLRKLKRFEELAALWRKLTPEDAKRFDPGEVLVEQGKAMDDLGRYAEAEKLLREAVVEAPDQAENHYELGKFLVEQADREANPEKRREGISEIRRAIELDPELAKAHFLLGELLVEEGKLEEAEKYIRKAVELRGKDKPKYLRGLAELLLKRKKYREALEAARSAVEAALPNRPKDAARYKRLQARALLALNRPKEAQALLREVMLVLQNDPETVYLLAKARAASGDRDGAAEVVTNYFNPEGDIWRARAWALLGRAKEALRFLRLPEKKKDARALLSTLEDSDFHPIRKDPQFVRFYNEVKNRAD